MGKSECDKWIVPPKKIQVFFKVFILFLMATEIVFLPLFSFVYQWYFFLTSLTIFLALSITYFSFCANTRQKKETLFKMWKLLFSIISLMLILIYTTVERSIDLHRDVYKTELLYDLQVHDSNAPLVLKQYKNYMDRFLQDKNSTKEKNHSKVHNEKKLLNRKHTFYQTFAIFIMIEITLFMFLWMLSNVNDIDRRKKVLKGFLKVKSKR
jgi:energy-coupling factor transporter transmembrane protein EcfT